MFENLLPLRAATPEGAGGAGHGSDLVAAAERALGPPDGGCGHGQSSVESRFGPGGYVGAFPPTALTVWCKRFCGLERPQRIFEWSGRSSLRPGGEGGARRAMDLTIPDDAHARQDLVTRLIAAIRRMARVVPGADVLVVTTESPAQLPPDDHPRPGPAEGTMDSGQCLYPIRASGPHPIRLDLQSARRLACPSRGGQPRVHPQRPSPPLDDQLTPEPPFFSSP